MKNVQFIDAKLVKPTSLQIWKPNTTVTLQRCSSEVNSRDQVAIHRLT
jgi:hypothetical protein